jgi:O-antigen/teichoic acid export membrane protein
MVLNLIGAVENAYFYVAWAIGSLLYTIPVAVSHSLFAEGSHFEDELGANIRRSLKFILLIMVPAVIILVLVSKWLLLLFGAEYSENATALLRILSLSGIFVGIDQIYFGILRVKGRVKELSLINGLTTLVVLVGSYFIMQECGLIGIGYVWIATKGAVTIYIMYAMRPFYSSGRR